MSFLEALYQKLFLRHFEALSREAEAERAGLSTWDARPLWVLVSVALILVFEEYYGDRATFSRLFRTYANAHYFELGEFAWWSGSKVLGYFLVPAALIKLSGGRLSEHGLTLRGLRSHAWIYVVLYLAILPVVAAASYQPAFRATYPFYRLASRSYTDLFAWELLYAVSFLALEFFFRGFMLFSLKRAFGAHAVFVMIVPYCMIHFQKPLPEVVGAIFAGIVLGTLAMVTRSIFCGVLIHISVAWTMDLLALWHNFGFPPLGQP